MIQLEIPGRDPLQLTEIVFDVNGTLAVDGDLIPGTDDLLSRIGDSLTIHLLTANTHGKQAEIDRRLNLKATIIRRGKEAEQKANLIEKLGPEHVIAVGQGANDAQMIKKAAVGICLLSPEGTAIETLLNADILFPDLESALQSILQPLRLAASLRK